jgi:DNA gyrase/topoisomerase IV subunit B
VFKALSDAIKPYRKKRHTFTPTDLRDGVVGIVNFKISSPQFNNQVKEKLIDTRVSKPCYDLALEELQAFFASNKAMANRLCDRAQDLKGLKNEFAANKKVSRELSKVAKSNRALLPGKFLSSPRAKPNERELFIVEGESAKGSCEKARDASFQEVLPLKGKPLNVIKNKPERALESEEVMNILMCIGYDPSRPNPYDHLRVGKVILLADADDDGFHINLLVLAVFQRFLPKMFERGMIYVAKGPEYIICTPKANYTASSLEDLKKKIPNQSLLKQVIHLKGWGEVSHEALEQIAFNAKTRKMWKIMPISDKKKVRDYTALVGEDPLFRKQLLGVA